MFLRKGKPCRNTKAGGIKGYPQKRLREEVAFLAYHLHWDYETLMELDHRERQRWCAEVSEINKKMNEDKGEISLEKLL